MSNQPRKRSRKKYLEPNEAFIVPSSTRHFRSRLARTPDETAEEHQASTTDCENESTINVTGAVAAEATEDGAGSSEGGPQFGEVGSNGTQPDNWDDGLLDDTPQEDSTVDAAEIVACCFESLQHAILPISNISKAEVLAMVMTFVTSENLTWSGLDKLLLMINRICGMEVLPRTKYLFRKLLASKLKRSTDYYYCEFCEGFLPTPEDGTSTIICTTCQKRTPISELRSKGNFFTILDVSDQVRQVVSKTSDELYSNLERLNSNPEDTMSDITDGRVYRKMKASGALQWGDLTMTFNTDGSPIFKSSKASVWPLQFVINEVPAPDRFSASGVAGIWFGAKHPDMSLFVGKFVEHLSSMDPIIWQAKSQMVSSKVYAVCCCLDAPARAAVQNQVQFNGYFGCPWCMVAGEHLEGAMRFPEAHQIEERTHELVLRDMKYAVTYDTTVNGFKGPSPLINLENYDMVSGQACEYMHSVLLGVTKQLTEHLLDSSNSAERFYIGSPQSLESANKLLMSIRPPHCITRLPRSLCERSYWKANEWRNWLLYYSVPCLENLLPHRYWKHWCLLAEAIWILLSTRISQEMISHAESLLKRFVDQVLRLYNTKMMTFNMHQLLHLAKSVRDLGPLWAHSAFVFETGNGKLVKCVTAAKGVPLQILERVCMAQEVELLPITLSISSPVKAVCDKMLKHRLVQTACEVDGATLLGQARNVTNLSASEQEALLQAGYPQTVSVGEYFRFVFEGNIITSRQYTREKKSDSSVIMGSDSLFYVINRIVELPAPSKPCLLLCKEIVTIDGDYPGHMQECFISPSNIIQALPLSLISSVCVFVDIGNKAFVCKLPNRIERD
ncbi:unnamed protein product [Ixodes persulcatus]